MSRSDAKRALRIALWIFALVFVVIAICLIQRSRELSARLVCAANLKGLAACVKTNADGTDANVDALLNRLAALGYWGPGKTVPHCPVGNAPYRFTNPDPLSHTNNDPRTIYVYEPLSNHGGVGGNVIYADGHTEFLHPQAFKDLCKAQGILLDDSD